MVIRNRRFFRIRSEAMPPLFLGKQLSFLKTQKEEKVYTVLITLNSQQTLKS